MMRRDDHWADHARLADWQYEVANGDTCLGFRDWLADAGTERADLVRVFQHDLDDAPDLGQTPGLPLVLLREDGAVDVYGAVSVAAEAAGGMLADGA